MQTPNTFAGRATELVMGQWRHENPKYTTQEYNAVYLQVLRFLESLERTR